MAAGDADIGKGGFSVKIVVLAGGLSSERAVSLVTGSGVCRALRERGHRAVLVDLYLGLPEAPAGLEALFDAPDGLCPQARIETQAPDLEEVRRSRPSGGESHIGPRVLEICALADVVFIGLHGQDGEDGRIQAVLDLMGVPYTGSGHLASAVAMDKAVSKQIMDSAGIPTPKWQLLDYGPDDVERLAAELPMPCVVKTVGGGSSLGVYLPEDRPALKKALEEVLRYGSRRWPCWGSGGCRRWRRSRRARSSTTRPNIRPARRRRPAPPTSPTRRCAPPVSLPCGCTGRLAWRSIPART